MRLVGEHEVLESAFVEMDLVLDGFCGVLVELVGEGEGYVLLETAAGTGNRLLRFSWKSPDLAHALFEAELRPRNEHDTSELMGGAMSTVVMHNVVSVDGYIADDNDDVGPLFEWYFNGDNPLTPGEMDEPSPGGMRVSEASYDYVRPTWDAIGSMVIGRHLFDMTNGWEGRPPAGEHVVVVSHRPKPDGWHPEASYHFVADVARAIAKAKELAGERTVAVAAGEVGGQALALGLVDEVAMDVVPVVFGSGKRYFGSVDGQHLLEDPDVLIRGDRVLHLRYRVRR